MKPSRVEIGNVVTIEQTGKRWKLQKLLSKFAIIAGIVLLIFSSTMIPSIDEVGKDHPFLRFLIAITFLGSLVAILAGIIGYYWARIGIWWHHR